MQLARITYAYIYTTRRSRAPRLASRDSQLLVPSLSSATNKTYQTTANIVMSSLQGRRKGSDSDSDSETDAFLVIRQTKNGNLKSKWVWSVDLLSRLDMHEPLPRCMHNRSYITAYFMMQLGAAIVENGEFRSDFLPRLAIRSVMVENRKENFNKYINSPFPVDGKCTRSPVIRRSFSQWIIGYL